MRNNIIIVQNVHNGTTISPTSFQGLSSYRPPGGGKMKDPGNEVAISLPVDSDGWGVAECGKPKFVPKHFLPSPVRKDVRLQLTCIWAVEFLPPAETWLVNSNFRRAFRMQCTVNWRLVLVRTPHSVTHIVQSLNSPFFPPHIGLNPGGRKKSPG